MRAIPGRRKRLVLTAFLLAMAGVPRAQAQTAVAPGEAVPPEAVTAGQATPPELAGLEVVEHLDAKLPLELEFSDHAGRTVKLGEYFDGKRPVILTLNYYRCPMLCGLTLNAMVDGLKEIDWTAGEEFRILTISFDPLETPDLAYLKRNNYLTAYERPAAGGGWDFLTGREASIQPLLEATGFPVRWNEKRREWIHPPVLILATPDGRISRYLHGVYFEPKTLRLSLVEASEGKIGTTVDHIILWCFHYDPSEGRYSVAAMNFVRAGGIMTALVVGTIMLTLWRRERWSAARRGAAKMNDAGAADHDESEGARSP